MTRRDLIIVAVLANIAVLAILFMLAWRTDEEKPNKNSPPSYTVTEETNGVTPVEARSKGARTHRCDRCRS